MKSVVLPVQPTDAKPAQSLGVKIYCKNLTATEEFKCSANDLYRVLTTTEVMNTILFWSV